MDEFRDTFVIKPFPSENTYHTIGGFIIFMVGEIPIPDQSVEWRGQRFEILNRDGYRVDNVLVEVVP